MSSDRSNNPWLYDLRLRDRNLRSGALDEKELARHLSALKDVEAEAETFSLGQPAIGSGEIDPVDVPDNVDEPGAAKLPAGEGLAALAADIVTE